MLGRDRSATRAEGAVRRKLIVIVPAGNLGPGERNVLAAADLQRKVKQGIGNNARRRMRGSAMRLIVSGGQCKNGDDQDLRYRGYRQHRNAAPQANDVIGRFPFQPASSSDRVRWYRGQKSRRR